MHRVALAVVLLISSLVSVLVSGALVGGTAVATSTAAVEEGRTWVVDAIDDTSSNRWESVDTGTSTLTVAVGDTVEWQFDRATQGHDLTSQAPTQPWETAWVPSLEAYRDADGEPVRYTFTEPGTYRYLCSIHGTMMSGTVVVSDAGDNQPPTAEPVVSPTSGPAPLVVHATAHASDPDGDVVAVSWDFGTGGPATYTDHAMADYGGTGPSVTGSVQVVVGGGAPPVVLPVPPVPPVVQAPDLVGPRISHVAPRPRTSDRTPTVRATVRDRASRVRRRSLVLRLDGRRVSGVRYGAARGRVRWTPGRRLAPGRHVVRLVARDTAGNRSVRPWRFTLRR